MAKLRVFLDISKFFDLLEGDGLTPGIYIVRQGNKAIKVAVK